MVNTAPDSYSSYRYHGYKAKKPEKYDWVCLKDSMTGLNPQVVETPLVCMYKLQ